MNDVQAWHETPGAKLRRVLGVVDVDVSVPAKELLDQAELEHGPSTGLLRRRGSGHGKRGSSRRWPSNSR